MNEVIEIESIPTKIKYKNIVWVPEHVVDNVDVNFTMPKDKLRVKKSYLIKWLENSKNIGDMFTLNEFYGKYPKHKKDQNCKKRVEWIISGMIADKRILQVGKDRFKLVQ